MERRNFVAGIAAFALSGIASKSVSKENIMTFVKPKKLKLGDRIAVIAPGTAVSDPEEIIRAKQAAEYFGLVPVFGTNLEKGSGYKSRTISERLDDLHSAFRDDSINGVFCIRGGYGSPQILDGIDYELIRKKAKVFCGYSDITAMHLAINKHAGIVTFHGPVLASAFTPYTIDYLKKAIFESNSSGYSISNTDKLSNIRPVHPVRTIKPGTAKGKLIGGNLSLISNLMGTPFEIETKGKILFIEDVGEEPFRLDRMLTQLKLAKVLQNSAGIIIGECKSCNYDGLQSSRVWDSSFPEIIDRIFSDINVPVFSGLTLGHTDDQATIPLGIEAEIDAGKCILTILENTVLD